MDYSEKIFGAILCKLDLCLSKCCIGQYEIISDVTDFRTNDCCDFFLKSKDHRLPDNIQLGHIEFTYNRNVWSGIIIYTPSIYRTVYGLDDPRSFDYICDLLLDRVRDYNIYVPYLVNNSGNFDF